MGVYIMGMIANKEPKKINLVKTAMLAVQRYPWEQGVCMQALYEIGDINTAIAMAHDAVLRQYEDGRLAAPDSPIAVTDPAANGEVVFRAYEITQDTFYLDAANRMYEYLMTRAPRTDKGIICHNTISFQEGFSPNQIWADAIYMAPPFIAVMGNISEAYNQIVGMYECLIDHTSGLLRHIYDSGTERFVRDKLWATGNAWALMGMGRVIDLALAQNENAIAEKLITLSKSILDAMLPYQLEDGRYHDILNDEGSFVDGASAMMCAAYIYRGVKHGWMDEAYLTNANLTFDNMDKHIDDYGIIHGVCGCPHFVSEGTSAESMAAYLMMHAWKI